MVNFLMKGVLWQHKQKSNSLCGGRRKGTGVSIRGKKLSTILNQ